MKTNYIFYLLIVGMLISSCKESDTALVPEKKLAFVDSVSFAINGKTYIANERDLNGIGNRQINIKPSATLIADQNWAYDTGGFYWYGEKDSILYDTFYGFSSKDYHNNIKISFSKKYNKNQLHKSSQLLVPDDNFDVFRIGRQSFAVDLNLENTMAGVSIEFQTNEIATQLSSYIPGFSILVKTSLTKDIQDNSQFEIIKVQKLDDKFYLIEAKFEMNLFDKNGKLYRVENGFLRLNTAMKSFNGFEQI